MTAAHDEAVLRRAVGQETLLRGQHYARCGAVLSVQWDPAGDRVFGQVRGNAARPYSAIAVLRSGTDGALTSFAGTCTCPVGTDCKHCVALVLTRPQRSRTPSWEHRLIALDDSPVPASGPGVALQFDPSVHLDRLVGLAVRPVLPGRNGAWVRTGISWSTLHLHSYPAYGYSASDYSASGRSPVDARQLRLLTELQALDQGGPSGHWAGPGTPLELADFPSRRLWDVLGEAVGAGLPLVLSGKAAPPVHLHPEPLQVHLDAGRERGRLVLRAAFGSPPSPQAPQAPAAGAVLLLGDPAHGVAWRSERGELQLAPLAGEVDPVVRGLLLGEPLSIPRADEDLFFSHYYPRLRRRVTLTSSTGTVELPQVQHPTLLLTADRRDARRITLGWRWSYRVGTAEHDVAMYDDGAACGVDRDTGAESAIVSAVAAALAPLPGTLEPGPTGVRPAPQAVVRDLDAVVFATDVLPVLQQLPDLAVELIGDPADYRQLAGATEISFTDTTADHDRDWFDLAVRVTVGDDELPFEPLFVALATEQSHLLLDDGRWLDLDRPELRELARIIAEARAVHDQPRRSVRVSRFQAGLWDELDAVGRLSGRAASWQQSVRALADVDRLPVIGQPAQLHAQLRPYQQDGLNWLAFLFDNRLGGVLADDMGLGKTLQTLALVTHVRRTDPQAPPFLIVAPTTVMSNWQAEAARFAPSLRTHVITETAARRRTPLTDIAAGADVVITSYTLFRLEHDAYSALSWSGLVLDEAQAAKNHLSRNYACAKRLDTPFKLAITGTPMENHLGELWSLLSITAPGLFPTPARFEEYYRRPIERDRDAERLRSLRTRIRPVMLRRTKDQVAADLPDKQEQVLEVELHPRHRRAYETLLHRERQKVLGLLDDLDGNRFEILRSLTLLRQASLDIGLVDPANQSIPATKLDVLVELLDGIVADGHRTLVFSQFTRFLRAARDRLDIAGIDHCYLDGSTRDRPKVIARFKEGTAPVFLISLKAGGVGLNLTEADYCVLLDPWWNPATEAQAIDRTHRIGQTRKVMVYRMVAKQTIEEKVTALKDRKAALFADVLGDGAFSGARLSAADIRAMLE